MRTASRDAPPVVTSRLLRVAVPMTLLAVAVFIAYLLYPDWFDAMGLVIQPELKYVRGPPPT